MYRKYHGFLHLFASRSQSKPTKNTGIYSVLTRQHAKKHDVFEQFFRLFQPMLLRSKNAYFSLFFCHRSSRLKKALNRGQIAKLHLNSTFCLSQSLPQSCNTKNYRRLSGASKCYKITVFYERTMHFTCKKNPPQLKLTVLVPPERHALLHLRCGRILFRYSLHCSYPQSHQTFPLFTCFHCFRDIRRLVL